LARCVLGKLQVHCPVQHVVAILLSSSVVACLFSQVNIQKVNGVRMKIIGTHVDATEIVILLLSILFIV
jgi:hypothetical protein